MPIPDPAPPPDSVASPPLSYRGVPLRSMILAVTFERAGEVLTITVPPPSFSRQILWRSFVLFLCILPASALILFCFWAGLQRLDPGLACVMLSAALFSWASVHALRRLLYVAREGHSPSIVRVWPAGMAVRAAGKLKAVEYLLPRENIRSVHIHPGGGVFGGFNPTLMLEVISSDDTLYLASIPWQTGEPMIGVEDNIRDVLGMAPSQ